MIASEITSPPRSKSLTWNANLEALPPVCKAEPQPLRYPVEPGNELESGRVKSFKFVCLEAQHQATIAGNLNEP
jgi:hypothetical protein